jgi:hypothetical protein
MDTESCRQPGCGRRWTMDIERKDGLSTFMCQPHGSEYLHNVAEDELAAVRVFESDWPGLLTAPPDVQDGNRPVSRQVRRQAERKARKLTR